MPKEYNVKYGETIYDLALITGYGMDNIYALIQENIFIEGIDFDFDANPLKTICYSKTFSIPVPQLSQEKQQIGSEVQSTTIVDGQTIYDIVIQTSIGIENIYLFLVQNGISNINDGLTNNTLVKFNTTDIVDAGFYSSLIKRGIKISTGQTATTIQNNFLLRYDYGYLLRTDTGKFIRL